MTRREVQGPVPTRRLHELCSIEGHLALNVGYRIPDDEPVIEHWFIVANHVKVDQFVEGFLGKTLSMGASDGYCGTATREGAFNYTIVDLRGSEDVVIREPQKRPRNGKEYTWKWIGGYGSRGPWVQAPFPKCQVCKHWHDPAFIECEQCGYCHKEGGKCKTGY